jgi:hypothetical protein
LPTGIHALCALHKFIRRWRTGDDTYDKLQEEEKRKDREEGTGMDGNQEPPLARQDITAQAMTAFRASSAKRMWRDYQQYKLDNSF